MASTMIRFRNASQAEPRGDELDEDLAAGRARAGRAAAGKQTCEDAADAREAPDAAHAPGKLTRVDADPGAMSPGDALHYARWIARGVDRKAEPGAAQDEGSLASAFGFLDEIRGGEPLPDELRERLARELDVDLRGVRIHIGEAAARAAAALGARAFTVGDQIYFAAGAYDPHGAAGLRLIAHEAAHVAQHARGEGGGGDDGGGGGDGASRVSRPDDAHERDADAFADGIAGELARGGDPAGETEAAAPVPAAATALPAAPGRGRIQRKTEAEMSDHEKQLFAIQGQAMFALLPSIAGLPGDVKTDYEAGRAIGGPRLVAAMKAVAGKGADWLTYANANHGDMGGLPADQIRDLMTYLGAPKDARYYKDVPGATRRYDGAVDPATSTITLFFRAKIVIAGAEEGIANPVSRDALEQFKPKFKSEVETAWSGGSIKPAKAIAGVTSFTTKTNVSIVDGTEHLTFYIVPEELGSSNVNNDRGQLREHANDESSETCEVWNDTSGKTGRSSVTNTQRGSTHEFGHAVGLDHPRPQASSDGKCAPAYGKTPEERGSIMGAGHERRVLKRGGVDHNDFEPHMKIGEKWGEEILPGPLKSHNKWSAG